MLLPISVAEFPGAPYVLRRGGCLTGLTLVQTLRSLTPGRAQQEALCPVFRGHFPLQEGSGGTSAGFGRCQQTAGLHHLPATLLPSQLAHFRWGNGEEVGLEGGHPPARPWPRLVPRGAALLCWQTGATAPRGGSGRCAEMSSIIFTVDPLRFMRHSCQGPFWLGSFMATWLHFSSQPRTSILSPQPSQVL